MTETVREKPSSAGTLSRDLTTELLRRIIDGVYPAGARLPTERELAVEFRVARTVVREALKRIEAFGLLTIRQGSGARVEDLQTVGGLELADLLMVRRDGSIDEEFLKDAMKLHKQMHGWLVREAALQATPSLDPRGRRRTKQTHLRDLEAYRSCLAQQVSPSAVQYPCPDDTDVPYRIRAARLL